MGIETAKLLDDEPPIGGPVPVFFPEEVAAFRAWLIGRPEHVQARVLTHPPGLYLLNDNQRVLITAYEENPDGTCTSCRVNIFQDYNPHLVLALERSVFGIAFEDLKPIHVMDLYEGHVL